MTWKREYYSLLSAPILFSAAVVLGSCGLESCGQGQASKPDLPQSVSPGWKLSSLDRSAAPSAIPSAASSDSVPQCWKANYDGPTQGTAQVWVCQYKVSATAFDALQRARTEVQTVKFQSGTSLVLVKWNGASKTDITALIRGLEKAVQSK